MSGTQMSRFTVGSSVYDQTNNQVVREVKLPPVLTNRECLDSIITCRVCWNGYNSCGIVYIRDRSNNTCIMQKCPSCNGTREMKSTTKQEKEEHLKDMKENNIRRELYAGS